MFTNISEKESVEARVEALSWAVLDEVTNLTAGTAYGFLDRALEVDVMRWEKSGPVIGWALLMTTGGPRVEIKVFTCGWSSVVVSETGCLSETSHGYTTALVDALIEWYGEE